VLLGVGLRGAPALDAPARGQVAVDEVVRRGLVGDEVGGGRPRRTSSGSTSAALPSRATDRARAGRRVPPDARDRIVEVARLLVDVARAQAKVDPRLLAFDDERAGAGEGRRERLRAAHAAEAGGEDPAACQAATVVLPSRLDERLERSLHDALRADVDPRARGHLPVHHEPLAIELGEVLPGRPLRHQVRIGEQHPRRVGVVRNTPTGLPDWISSDSSSPSSLKARRIASNEAQSRAALPMPP
jgi:hypothetical protein